MRRARWVAALAISLSQGLSANFPARASDYPTKPITLMLPLGAGGAMDILARAQFEPKLKERLGKPVIIENRTGGGTVIAATVVAKSAPDGYTLFFVPAGTLTTNATLYKKLPYDPGKDFTPIALTSSVAFVLVVNPALPVHSLKELIAYVKERPGQLSFGSTGIGATPHLAFEILRARRPWSRTASCVRWRCRRVSASARWRMCRPWRRPVLRASMRCHGT